MYCKIVVTKGIYEVFEYEKLNVKGNGGTHEADGKKTEENYKQRQRQRRNVIRQLVCSNFDSGSKFVTLTFRDTDEFDIKDVKQCNVRFKQFVQRLKYQYPKLQYVAVIEFQDENGRGAVHYHMICNLPYIKKSELTQIWENGHVKINRIDKVDNVGAYVIKYMTADMDDKRLMGLKAYNCSKGLKKPVEVKSWTVEEHVFREWQKQLKEKTPTYCSEYVSEYAGTIKYSQYNMNRKGSK